MRIAMKLRTLQDTILQVSRSFPVLLVTGPRQVGKTTLLESCAEPGRGYVTLDDFELRDLAQTDPALFLQIHKPPIIIDEIQYAPQLFNYIKMIVDKEKTPGLYWLTGSQKFSLMQHVTESLAGRIAILDLLGLSQAEMENRGADVQPFLPTAAWIEHARSQVKAPKTLAEIYQQIWLGSYPKVLTDEHISRDLFYHSYIQTYLQRDVRDLLNITKERDFRLFLRAIAARTGQLLNYSDLARDVDIDHKTAKAWLSVLEASGIIYLLQPYHSNVSFTHTNHSTMTDIFVK